MSLPTPSTIAVRAVNQYRGRDLVPYLALRYYLANRAARRTAWPLSVAAPLVLRRQENAYYRVKHFKELDDGGLIRHRELHLPGANEILAEGAVLAACSRHDAFRNASTVFSYEISRGSDTAGMFYPYFDGLRRRQRYIANACAADAKAVVVYSDVRRFYPSISHENAVRAWKTTAVMAGLESDVRAIGFRLLDNYSAVERRDEHGILTGPMFSHVVANLVLKSLDEEMSTQPHVSYCRYVDDVVIVGRETAVKAAYGCSRASSATWGLSCIQRVPASI